MGAEALGERLQDDMFGFVVAGIDQRDTTGRFVKAVVAHVGCEKRISAFADRSLEQS